MSSSPKRTMRGEEVSQLLEVHGETIINSRSLNNIFYIPFASFVVGTTNK